MHLIRRCCFNIGGRLPWDTGSKRALACGHLAFAFPFPSQSFTFIRASCCRQPCLLGKKVLSSCPLNLFSFCFLFYVGFCSVLSSILGLSFPFSWAARGCGLVYTSKHLYIAFFAPSFPKFLPSPLLFFFFFFVPHVSLHPRVQISRGLCVHICKTVVRWFS